jgi:hypothetical protein
MWATERDAQNRMMMLWCRPCRGLPHKSGGEEAVLDDEKAKERCISVVDGKER